MNDGLTFQTKGTGLKSWSESQLWDPGTFSCRIPNKMNHVFLIPPLVSFNLFDIKLCHNGNIDAMHLRQLSPTIIQSKYQQQNNSNNCKINFLIKVVVWTNHLIQEKN